MKETIFKGSLVEAYFLCTPLPTYFHGAQMSLRAQRYKGNGEIIELQYMYAVELKVCESPSFHGYWCAL